jgi:hypothetical protein
MLTHYSYRILYAKRFMQSIFVSKFLNLHVRYLQPYILNF